jgi:23S rRNA (cytidine1920-2'-O)/16S rRNA (cytidine1409-2'-O)-methyltransferase
MGPFAEMMAAAERLRLDQALVSRGLVASRERGQSLIRAGLVRVSGQPAAAADQLVPADADIRLVGADQYVSRGAEKLAAALDAFRLDPSGRRCLDVGASTGGFTEVLLRRGAASVIAVDVGYGQLAWSIRNDSRVKVLERVNVRLLDQLPSPADLAVIDVSFISLRLVLPRVFELLDKPADVVALVKPQFEVGRGRVGKGGVVRSAEDQAAAVRDIGQFAIEAGFRLISEVPSPITGAKGNREFFLHLKADG